MIEYHPPEMEYHPDQSYQAFGGLVGTPFDAGEVKGIELAPGSIARPLTETRWLIARQPGELSPLGAVLVEDSDDCDLYWWQFETPEAAQQHCNERNLLAESLRHPDSLMLPGYQPWLVLLLKGGRIKSLPLTGQNKLAVERLFSCSLAFANENGTEYWNILGLTPEGESLRRKGETERHKDRRRKPC